MRLNNIYIIIIIMNLTADQSCNHAVLISSKHAEKSEKSKNSCLNLLYTYCNFLYLILRKLFEIK